ncbi:resistin-like beta [Microcaecilia unicolor]|uniref:Resistin-like beta n=1 Tax=Microcaecilia unicolor TaxID=1415580 RepID=A0A6P7Z4N3_9AMPH|nr:resistin-like beta [Microcaecilia unicolor]
MKVIIFFLLIVLLESGFVAANPDQCTISDLETLEKFCKPKECECKLSCSSVKANGAYATCPTGKTAAACSCGMACGSWDIQNEATCHCQCSGIDWTTARCC